ncbi:hypothetical protein J6I44_19100 [Aliifodinibius sp. 1BSP15-2V2]|uniref:Uncharacterized protein n=2 Tax=Fodinibius salsisoli TaxID=2820877 RepID=A0ABT3PT07_9BACT|nr:hypothetical protein [Fodinibius salsisoli]
MANTNSSDPDRETAHLQPFERANSQAKPDDNANRFRIPHQGESGSNILSRLVNPDTLTEVEDSSSGKLSDDSRPTNYASFNYRVARNLERSLTIKKLIFPFHSFL